MLRACLGLPFLVAAVTCLTSLHYFKVDNSFPDSIAPCLLSSLSFPPAASPLLRCGAVCSQNRYCSLYCLKGTTCDTFRAKVTQAWVGPGSGTYHYDNCYSIHPTVGDVALNAPAASSSIYTTNYPQLPTSANFFCVNEPACFESHVEARPWWRADLGTAVRVTRVRISLIALIDSSVEFRVGNDTTVTNNPVLLPAPSFTPYSGLEVVADTPLVGRYFFVTEPTQSDIRLCDVWVMTS